MLDKRKDPVTTFVHHDQKFSSTKQEFNWLQERYGKCIGKSFRDLPNNDSVQTGWVFVKDGVETWVSYKPYMNNFKRAYHELKR